MTNSVHDMGGMHGFGPVESEPSEPVFHERWEARVRAMQRALGATGLWTLDGFRAAQEELPALTYLAASYYERWFRALERQAVKHGLVGDDEIAAGRSLRPGIRLNRKLTLEDAKANRSGRYDRPAPAPARFKEGERVRARNNPQWLYTVVFSASELWGEEADPKISVSIEAFEPYLVAA